MISLAFLSDRDIVISKLVYLYLLLFGLGCKELEILRKKDYRIG